ncbi:hypothetical protein M430DRAFT_38000 [Amorphotheca resinae ATCC 22711]|uniref:DUF7598 domain-containing protein n=1 Tax=Amorphotheca resinae ATCC 22711 TaxID=857342 RepID=A0A2T3BCS5_AMORE|nr:hypothetical protein M430DRAFT_38000 [Amorphotheca resinae ATCC 22711]PSS27196.1 hypothetical protein M430DRAFT_38000 [Amorphotheca resinae ATCC 22711]
MKPDSKLRGPGYIILNVLRVLNIISLITVVIASWVMLVRTVQTSNFFFFDGVSHFITSTIGIFLIVSELNLFKSYYARNWPLLSINSGFVFLGMAMIVLGFNILGNLNKSATSVQSLGLPLWRIVIASGILSSLMGLFNIIATFVFCDSKQGITGRQVRSHGAAIPTEPRTKTFSLSSGSRRAASPVLPTYNSTSEERRKSRFGLKFPIRLSHISKPVSNDPEQFQKWESRSSPVVPDIQRPPTALHPYHNAGTIAHEYPASSRYSEVSNLTRF